MSDSCFGCKFLYGDGDGYSDWTWLETDVSCALNNNPQLPKSECYDMGIEEMLEKIGGRCEQYSPGPYITISPDGERDGDFCDEEQERALREDRWIQDDD